MPSQNTKRKLYLINPRRDGIDTYGVSFLPDAKATDIAEAALPTVAALAPEHQFEVKLCDEQVDPIDFDYPADFIGITGKNLQTRRMIEVASAFRQRGIPVIIGGPHASLAPEEFREHCDVLVQGELEAIAVEFFDDLYRGDYKSEYHGQRGAIQSSPVPRWDLYSNDRALAGTLQTSRGCPFECEFCDVIAYLGRKQTHKTVPQVLAELDQLYKLGYRRVSLADDNLTVYRARARELLRALIAWNASVSEPVTFLTQLSIEISSDDEMLGLLAQASVRHVFIGIETPNEDALQEVKKRQNVGIDMALRAERFAVHGIFVQAGLIVGFDADGPDIFEHVVEFAQRTPIPLFNVAPLFAAHATPLRERLAREGRLHADVPTATQPSNIVPKSMTHQQLVQGVYTLSRELLAPHNFAQRTLRMIELFPDQGESTHVGDQRAVALETMLACHRVLFGSPELAPVAKQILAAVREKPSARDAALTSLFGWAQRLAQLRAWEARPHRPVVFEPLPILEAPRSPLLTTKRSLAVAR